MGSRPCRFLTAAVALQQFITIYVYQFRCIDDNVANATRSLALLNEANEVRPTVSPVVRRRPLSVR